MASDAPLPARYERARLTAHGGMGDIYVARDRVLKRDVAVKVLLERFAADHDLRERFKREGLAAARLSGHPHVVTIFDVGEWSGRPFIVMEYLNGGTLAARLRGAPVSPPQAIEWLAEIADALDAAHAEGIVHRDVKPANLLFDSRELLRVGDFGIARVLDDSSGLTLTGTVLGTTGYISPEQAQGQPATAASDVYSLAAVAYELLTGTRPFERQSSTAEAAAHAHEPPPRATSRNPELPPEVDAVFERALAKDPKRRQAGAGELVAELRRALEAPEQTTRLLPLPARTRVDRPRHVPRLVALGLLAALLVAAGIAAATILTTGGSDNNARTVVLHRTVTTRGRAVERRVTVTQTVEPPPAPASSPGGAATSGGAGTSGSALALQAYGLMQNGRYSQALPILRRAANALQGTYSQTSPDEAYNDYNLGYTLLQLGDCSEALRWLTRSEQLQGSRSEIDSAKAQANACLSPPAPSAGPGNGNGKAKGHDKGHGNSQGGEG